MAVLVGCVLAVFLAASISAVNLLLHSDAPFAQAEHCEIVAGSINGPAMSEECK
jgi:hypothetical protein